MEGIIQWFALSLSYHSYKEFYEELYKEFYEELYKEFYKEFYEEFYKELLC